RNHGDGTFTAPEWLTVGAAARAPVVADLDGDGVPDLATADATDGTVTVRRNAGRPDPHGAAGSFGTQAVGATGPAATITITNTGQARMPIAAVATTGAAADDFLVTGDACTGASVRSGGADACTVRVRFAPTAVGTRTAALHLRYAGGTLDVPLTGNGTPATTTDGGDDPGATTTGDAGDPATPDTATDAPAATSTAAPAAAVQAPAKAKAAKTKPLTLTLAHTKLTAQPGARLAVGFTLGRAAKLVLRVKHAGRTAEIVRLAGHSGRGTITWDGKLGKKPAPSGTYRLDLYAVAADGRAARVSAVLTVRV
ncbi:MAG TPA: choice-of-anchor D domain-containing protein, partial [Baekduia sp.]